MELIQQFSVGVMPLPAAPWARGKCAFKLILCMACAIPVIASPVGANVDAVPPTCGLLASSTDDWLAAFRQLTPILSCACGWALPAASGWRSAIRCGPPCRCWRG